MESPKIVSLDPPGSRGRETAQSAPTLRSPGGRVPELDGLRGMAILMVVVFHYLEEQGLVAGKGATAVLQRVVLMGWSGVDLFFVLSGFLIGGILMDARESPSYFKTFYARRVFRIIPIYYLWILAYVVLAGVAGPFLRAHSNSGVIQGPGSFAFSYFLFLQNCMIIPFAGLAGAWFAHLWSLAVEEQFYLISPLVVRILSGRHLVIFLGSTIVFAPLLRIALLGMHANAGLVSILMPCRADSLAIGMLAALLWRQERFRGWLSRRTGLLYAVFGALLAGVAALWKWSPESQMRGMETIGFTWLAAFYVVLLLLAMVRRDDPIARVARMSPLRQLGRISYCVYIIHIAVNVICHSLLRHAAPATTDGRGAAVTVFAACVTIGVAWISWSVLEGPLVRFGHSFKYRSAAPAASSLAMSSARESAN